MTKNEIDLTADPRLAEWLQRGAEYIESNRCPKCQSKALAQVGNVVRCCNCNHQWTVEHK